MNDLVIVFDEEDTLVIDDFVDTDVTAPVSIDPAINQTALQTAYDKINREGRLVV